VRITVPLVILAALALPAQASAEPFLGVELDDQSVRYGAKHTLEGRLVDGDVPLGAQEVVLEGLRYPYEGSYRVIARATTDDNGEFSFKPELDRNHRLRVVAPEQDIRSDVQRAYVLPAFELSFRALRPGTVRLYQRYTVPPSIRLSSPTLFYLGARTSSRASLRRTGEVTRIRAGRYTSQVDVTLPRGWDGEFRYASCFRVTPGTGMGDPEARCPKLRLKF
jgi:hypothetical protein